MSADSASPKKPARWMPFQCPACFSLFRVRKEGVGKWGRCPSCAVRLLVPDGSQAPQLSKALIEESKRAIPQSGQLAYAAAQVVESSQDGKTSREWEESEGPQKRRRFIGENEDDLGWENEDESGKEQLSWLVSVSIGMVVLLLISVGVYYVKTSGPETIGVLQEDSLLDEAFMDQLDAQKQDMISAAERDDNEARKMVDRFSKFDIKKIKEVVKGFLDSETIAERVKYCRSVNGLTAKMENHYGSEGIVTEGFRSLDQAQVSHQGNFIATFVELEDFSDAPIVIERLGVDEYRIDWESWVGYSDVKVDKMILLKPTKSIQMRALVRSEDYYNYGFSDDKKWKSLRLSFKDQERSLWAYVDRESEAAKAFGAIAEQGKDHPFIVKVKYPENGRAADQVILLELVSEGWVIDYPEDKDDE